MSLGPNFKLGSMIFIVFFAISAAGLYGGALLVKEDSPSSVAADGGGDVPAGPVTIEIVAENLKFDQSTITASAGNEVTVVLDNRDSGVLHNIAFYTNSRAEQDIFVGEIFPGPAVEEENFAAPGAPGDFFFRCDVHPDTMRGTFQVR